MLPIYTRYLSPEHYGTLELLSMVLDFAAILFGLRIAEAVFRFYYDTDDPVQQNRVISTALAMVGGLNAVAVVILVIAAGPISEAVFGTSGASRQLALYSFTLVFQSLTEMVMTYLRAQQRPWLYVGFSTIKLVVQLSLNIYFVVGRQMAVDGVIMSSLISSVVITVPLLWYTLSRTGLHFSREKARALVSFSAPLIITSIISFYMTFGDRYFLRVFGGGLDEVGVYALGYRFGFLLSFIVGDPFFGIWNSEKYIIAKQPDAQTRYQDVFLMLTAALLLVMVGISIYVHDVLRLMSNPEFWGAYIIVPIVMLGYVFQNWTGYSNLGLLLHSKTGDIATGTAISAIVITIGYLALIPPLGGVGAALATALAFGARMVWITMRSEKLYPMKLPWRRAMNMLLLGGVAWGLSLLAPEPIVPSVVVTTLIFIAFCCALLMGPGMLPVKLRRDLARVAVERARWLAPILGRGDDAAARPVP